MGYARLLTNSGRRFLFLRRRLQRLIEIGQDVVDMLDADRQAHVALGHAGRELFCGRELRVGRRRRVDDERASVADVGDVIEEFQRVDELWSRFAPAPELEADEAALPAAQVFFRALLAHSRLLRRMEHFGYLGP